MYQPLSSTTSYYAALPGVDYQPQSDATDQDTPSQADDDSRCPRFGKDRAPSAAMKLEFHQLDRRWEHLRVRHPQRQRRLLASLAESGQQTLINNAELKGLHHPFTST
jgi:hypothetical protein